MVYNEPMRIWARKVKPLLHKLQAEWYNDVSQHEKMNMMAIMTPERRKDALDTVKVMCILDLDHDVDSCRPTEAYKQNCSLYAAAAALHKLPTVGAFEAFLREYFDFMEKSNPWTVSSEFNVSIGIEENSHIRGGKMASFTGPLHHEPDMPLWWNCSLEPFQKNVFSSYVLLGNGNSGSTANTFQTTVEQIWKNRDQSGATRPLVSVSYGGIRNETPLTQFAGGTVDDSVNIEDPFVGLVGLHLLAMLFASSKMGEQIDEAANLLRESLPEVPYYLQRFTKLPAVEVYNKFMLKDGEAMPLEFVYMPPDQYIEEMYFGGIFEKPEGLESLYEQASHFFASGSQ
jgi:hypothetical protein